MPVYEDCGLQPPRYSQAMVEALAERIDSSLSEILPPPVPEDLRQHRGRVNEAFNPLGYALLGSGRFPFKPTYGHSSARAEDNSDRSGSNVCNEGSNYTTSILTFPWIYFVLTSLILVVLLIVSIGSFLRVMMSWTFFSILTWTKEQKELFEKNLIAFVLVWSFLLSATVGNISFVWNRKSWVKMLNYWNVAVDYMDMEIPKDLKNFLHMSNVWFLAFGIASFMSSEFLNLKLAKGGSTFIGVLACKVLVPDIEKEEWERSWVRFLGYIIILYSMYASRAMLFLFVFKCKLLRSCIKVWNARLRKELMTTRFQGPGRDLAEQTNCRVLFYHHVVILTLIRLMRKVFAAILLSYYGSQILNMCFELYYCAMRKKVFNDDDGDDKDSLVALWLLIQNIYVFLSVSLHAAYVGEEANKGYELIKSTGINVHDSITRRYLLLNLQTSYQHPICVTGGHYFTLDKPFILVVLGAVCTYFIIILQYEQQGSTTVLTMENGTINSIT